MPRIIQSVQLMALFFCLFSGTASFAHAGTPMSDRMAVEAGVKTEIVKDLVSPYSPQTSLSGRACLDGRPVDGFKAIFLSIGQISNVPSVVFRNRSGHSGKIPVCVSSCDIFPRMNTANR